MSHGERKIKEEKMEQKDRLRHRQRKRERETKVENERERVGERQKERKRERERERERGQKRRGLRSNMCFPYAFSFHPYKDSSHSIRFNTFFSSPFCSNTFPRKSN